MKDYKITRNKFFDSEERRCILKHTEAMAIADEAKGRRTWITRWMLVDLAFFSGLRVSEIAGLKISDIHLKAKDPYIFVRRGKGGRSRDVYIDRNLTGHLKGYIKIKTLWGESVENDAPLLAGRSGHYTPTALTVSFKKAVEQAGLRTDLSIHSARHTYATFLYKETQNLRYVQKQLGHADLNMTSLYTDVLPEQNGRLANKMANDPIKRSAGLDQLRKAAEELNNYMGLEPAIDTDSTDRPYFEGMLREALGLVSPTDQLTEDTRQVLNSL